MRSAKVCHHSRRQATPNADHCLRDARGLTPTLAHALSTDPSFAFAPCRFTAAGELGLAMHAVLLNLSPSKCCDANAFSWQEQGMQINDDGPNLPSMFGSCAASRACALRCAACD